MTRLEEVGRVRHLLQLRERLGLDTNPNPTTKTEKDVCNLAARASSSPVHMVIPPSPQTPIQEAQNILPDRDYSQREQELMMKCINLIQGRIGYTKADGATTTTQTATAANNLQVDASPGNFSPFFTATESLSSSFQTSCEFFFLLIQKNPLSNLVQVTKVVRT